MSHNMTFYLKRDWSKDDVRALHGLLLVDKYFLRNQYQHDSRKIILFFTRSIASILLNYFLSFSETGRYTDILIPVNSISNSISRLVISRNSFFLLKRNIKKISISTFLVKVWQKTL